MDKLEIALNLIAKCDLCNGKGYQYWGDNDNYEFESCPCNVYDLILDDDGDVIWDNGLISEPELFATMEAN
jgi:hypothetical protein